MKLTATQVKQAKPKTKPYKLADGEGMYLLVDPKGSKYWRLKYRYGGKEKSLALGVYPSVSLQEARSRKLAARDLLAKNIDPSEARRVERITRDLASADSFEAVAMEWYETKLQGKSDSYRDRTQRLLKKDLFPPLGNRPISQITAPELLMALRKVEARGAVDMAHRAKQTAGQQIFDAVAEFFASEFQTGHFMLSLDMIENEPGVSFKKNTVHSRLQQKGAA